MSVLVFITKLQTKQSNEAHSKPTKWIRSQSHRYDLPIWHLSISNALAMYRLEYMTWILALLGLSVHDMQAQ